MCTGDVCTISKIGGSVKSIQSPIVGVEGIAITEIVVADKELMLLRDAPIQARVDPLSVFDGGWIN